MTENAAAGPRSNCPTAMVARVLAEKSGGIAWAATGQHEGLGINHKAIHEPQQDRNDQHTF